MKRLISVFIIAAMLFSLAFGTILTYANEVNDTVPDIEDNKDNIGDNDENNYESEAVDVSLLIQKLAEIEAIKDIENKYNIKTVNAWVEKAKSAIENQNVTKTEIDLLITECDGIIANVAIPITSAEEFAAMKSDGNYILMTDIILNEAYGEFKGFLNGNGKTVTLDGASGVFCVVNGAVIRNLNIAGDINAQDSVGALASEAYGEVYITNVINSADIAVKVNDVNVAGFIAQISHNAKIYFYNCVNKGNVFFFDGVNQNCASGFIAIAVDEDVEVIEDTENTEDIEEIKEIKEVEFKYCANLGYIDSTYSSSAFFAYGNVNVEMYGCLNTGDVFVNYNVSLKDARPMGGFIGEAHNVTVENCIQLGSVIVENNFDTNPAALLIGGTDGFIALKNVVINGKVVSEDDNVYKITSTQDTVFENVFVNARLEKRTVFEGMDLSPIDVPNTDAIDKTPNTDTSFISDEVKDECKALAYDAIVASSDIDADLKIKALTLFFEFLDDVGAEMNFYAAKLEAKEAVEQMTVLPEGYTADSYVLYIADVNNLITSIDIAKSYEELEIIDIEKSVAEASSKLMTIEEAQNIELTAAKNMALTALSAKRENAGNMYTSASYDAYISAFDAIVALINEASSIDALNALDVAALKVAAEVKLVLVIPEPLEDFGDDEDFENDFDETEENDNYNDDGDAETLAPITHSKNEFGCSSSLAYSFVAIVASLGLAIVIKKKD